MAANRPVAIDLFSGAGGLSEGLLSAGINVAVAIEKHPHAALTCAFNHPNTTVVCDDIARLKMKSLARLVQERTGRPHIDLVAGGPPCQGFSPAGLRNPNDPRNSLFKYFIRVVKFFQPRMFVFENVPGFVRLYNGSAIKAIVRRFRRLGYELHGFPSGKSVPTEEYPLLNAAEYGVPQRRKRFVLVGWLPGEIEREFEWQRPTHGPNLSNEFVTVRDALDDLAFLTAGKECHCYLANADSEYQEHRRKSVLILFNHLATKHLPQTVKMYSRMRTPGSTIRSIPEEFRSGKQTMARLDPERLSKVVLALPDDHVHYRRDRIPTVREMARLQSFDDSFVFMGKRTTSDKGRRVDVPQYTQVGNAVPPLLAKAIGVAICRSLGLRRKDIRDLATRKRRHQWIHGSSGFIGYTFGSEAAPILDLVDKEGVPLPLPISDVEAPAGSLPTMTDWTLKQRRTSALVRTNGKSNH